MSGGSYDYAFIKVEDFIGSLRLLDNPERKAFKTLLVKVAAAMHDIEWVDSCDNATGSEIPAILAALGTDAPSLVLAEAIADAKRVAAELTKAIEIAERNRRSDSA